jgi:hypothetical protein
MHIASKVALIFGITNGILALVLLLGGWLVVIKTPVLMIWLAVFLSFNGLVFIIFLTDYLPERNND